MSTHKLIFNKKSSSATMGCSLPSQERQHICAGEVLSEDKHIGVLYKAKFGREKHLFICYSHHLGKIFSLS